VRPVTHDQEEAFAIADRVMIIQSGRLEQHGSPLEILDSPATEFVARFVGDVNVLSGVVEGERARIGPIWAPLDAAQRAGLPDGQEVHVVVRAYDLKFWRDDAGVASVRRVMTVGDRVRIEANLHPLGSQAEGPAIFAQFPRRSSLLNGIEPGVRISIEVTHARAWPGKPGELAS